MKKIIDCGKIDWNHTGRKVNKAELELKLEEKDGHWCFSCCGSVWNNMHTDILAGGQCLDEMFKHPELVEYKEIHTLWSRHHLNDMVAGSPKQEEAVKAWAKRREKAGKRYDYTEACEMLKKKGLLVDESYIRNGKPYEYGTAWLTRDIPDEDLTRIRKWMEI
jgi:hypothetical protein